MMEVLRQHLGWKGKVVGLQSSYADSIMQVYRYEIYLELKHECLEQEVQVRGVEAVAGSYIVWDEAKYGSYMKSFKYVGEQFWELVEKIVSKKMENMTANRFELEWDGDVEITVSEDEGPEGGRLGECEAAGELAGVLGGYPYYV